MLTQPAATEVQNRIKCYEFTYDENDRNMTMVATETTARILEEKIASRRARVGIVGLGYVGLPLAVEFAKAGFTVTGIDL